MKKLGVIFGVLTLDGGPRVRVDPANAWKYEPALGRQSGSFRAGQLYARAQLLRAAVDGS